MTSYTRWWNTTAAAGGGCSAKPWSLRSSNIRFTLPRTGSNTTRTVDFSLAGAFDPTTCHDILVTVALAWAPGGYSPATPPGGDQAHWAYRPKGAACQAYDAGPPPPDAGADADAATDASDAGVSDASEGGDP